MLAASLEKPNFQVVPPQKGAAGERAELLSGGRRGEQKCSMQGPNVTQQKGSCKGPAAGRSNKPPRAPHRVPGLGPALQLVNHSVHAKVQKGRAIGPARRACSSWRNAGLEPRRSGSLLLATCPPDHFLINPTKRHRTLLRPRHSLKERAKTYIHTPSSGKGICSPRSLH